MLSLSLDNTPFHYEPYLNAGGGKGGAYREKLPFLRGRIAGLPPGTPPMMLTADLQGRTDYGDDPETLLGCSIGDKLYDLMADSGIPQPGACLALLAGDFYTYPDAQKRGGTGDVDVVWDCIAYEFLETFGVAGNHDTFGDLQAPTKPPQGHLDSRCTDVGNLRIGGVAGVIGSPNKNMRRLPIDFCEALADVILSQPHIIILHQPPTGDTDGCKGSMDVRELLIESEYSGLVVCGHAHWPERIQRIGHCLCLNVHESVVILEPEEGSY